MYYREDDSIPLADEDASGRVDDSHTDNIPEDLRKVKFEETRTDQ